MAYKKRRPTDAVKAKPTKGNGTTRTMQGATNPRAGATAKFQAARTALQAAKVAGDKAGARAAHEAIKTARRDVRRRGRLHRPPTPKPIPKRRRV